MYVAMHAPSAQMALRPPPIAASLVPRAAQPAVQHAAVPQAAMFRPKAGPRRSELAPSQQRHQQQPRRHASRHAAVAQAAQNAPDTKYEDAEYDELADKIREVSGRVKERLGGTSVYLVGMMGSGKSTVGKLLSAALGYYFFESDSLVEQHTQMTVAQIFDAEGEEAFREVETAVLQELAPFRDCVVATGGGAAVGRRNWGHMSHAISVWLDGPPPLLAARVVGDGSASRPLAAEPQGSKDGDDYHSTVGRLVELLDTREKHYRVADVHVSLGHQTGDENRGATPAVVTHRVLLKLDARLAEKAADLESKRQATFEVKDDSKTSAEQ